MDAFSEIRSHRDDGYDINLLTELLHNDFSRICVLPLTFAFNSLTKPNLFNVLSHTPNANHLGLWPSGRQDQRTQDCDTGSGRLRQMFTDGEKMPNGGRTGQGGSACGSCDAVNGNGIEIALWGIDRHENGVHE
jgi:hypothetical protein